MNETMCLLSSSVWLFSVKHHVFPLWPALCPGMFLRVSDVSFRIAHAFMASSECLRFVP